MTSKRLEGASTITQQVAKNFLLTNEVSLNRKLKEAILAFRIERALTKERILELYLNQIYLGSGAYGVAAASLEYFDKSIKELDYAEAALLAALPKAPSKYNPYRDIELAETWEEVISFISKGLQPHIGDLKREINNDDIVKLTEIKIKRISKFDLDKAQQKIESLEADISEVKNNLKHLIDFAVRYFTHLKKTYGSDKERKSELTKKAEKSCAKDYNKWKEEQKALPQADRYRELQNFRILHKAKDKRIEI